MVKVDMSIKEQANEFYIESVKFVDIVMGQALENMSSAGHTPALTQQGPSKVLNNVSYTWKLQLVKTPVGDAWAASQSTKNTTPTQVEAANPTPVFFPMHSTSEKDQGWESINKIINEPNFLNIPHSEDGVN